MSIIRWLRDVFFPVRLSEDMSEELAAHQLAGGWSRKSAALQEAERLERDHPNDRKLYEGRLAVLVVEGRGFRIHYVPAGKRWWWYVSPGTADPHQAIPCFTTPGGAALDWLKRPFVNEARP